MSRIEAKTMVLVVGLTITGSLSAQGGYCTNESPKQNWCYTDAVRYVVDQGWHVTTFGNFIDWIGIRWYKIDVHNGRSYCVETAGGEVDGDKFLDTSLKLYSGGLAPANLIAQNDNDDAEPRATPFSRICLISSVNDPDALVVVVPTQYAYASTNLKFKFRVVDTTLTGPWWYVDQTSGYNAFIEIANSTSRSINVSARIVSAAGSVIGSVAFPLVAKGNRALSVATDFGVVVTNGSGSIELAHDGPPGAIVANVTSLSALQGLSFDAPAQRRQTK